MTHVATHPGGRGGEALRLATWLLLPVAVGALSGIVTAGAVGTWYQTIAKPGFTPPDAVFGPVWTTLYLMMGAAAYLATRAARRGAGSRPDARRARALFLLQLALNGAWSLIFFGLRSPGAALVEIMILWGAIAATIAAFAKLSRPAAALLVPYLAWVSYAAALNGAIWWLNR